MYMKRKTSFFKSDMLTITTNWMTVFCIFNWDFPLSSFLFHVFILASFSLFIFAFLLFFRIFLVLVIQLRKVEGKNWKEDKRGWKRIFLLVLKASSHVCGRKGTSVHYFGTGWSSSMKNHIKKIRIFLAICVIICFTSNWCWGQTIYLKLMKFGHKKCQT